MLDYYAFSMLERIVMLENGPWDYAFQDLEIKSKYQNLYNYVHNFRNNPIHISNIIKKESYDKLLLFWI